LWTTSSGGSIFAVNKCTNWKTQSLSCTAITVNGINGGSKSVAFYNNVMYVANNVNSANTIYTCFLSGSTVTCSSTHAFSQSDNMDISSLSFDASGNMIVMNGGGQARIFTTSPFVCTIFTSYGSAAGTTIIVLIIIIIIIIIITIIRRSS